MPLKLTILGWGDDVFLYPIQLSIVGHGTCPQEESFQKSFLEESCRSVQQVCVKHEVKHEENEKKKNV